MSSGNFIEGGEIDPFTGRAPGEMTLTEQARLEDQRRQAALRAQSRGTASVNSRPGGYNEQRGADAASEHAAEVARYGGQEGYDKHWADIKQRNFRERHKNFWGQAADTVSEHPWLPLLPLAPLGLAALAPAAPAFGAGAGVEAGAGAAAGEAVVPVANEATGLATAGPGFSAEAANAYNAANAANAVGTTSAAAGGAANAVETGKAAFDVGGAVKEGLGIATAVGPLAYNAIAGGRTKEEKALVAKQEQMAREAKARMAQVQESRMNALGQQLLAMNPRNKMMAQMYGPDAAFQPQEFAAMTQNPMPPPEMPDELKRLAGNTKPLTPAQKAAYAEFERQKQQYAQGNQQRSDQMMNGMAPPGPGAAPLQQRTPQAARKY